MKLDNKVALFCGMLAGGQLLITAHAAGDPELLLSAPIEQIDHATDTITVLGQQFHADSQGLSVGQVANVYGVISKDGSITDAVVEGTDAVGGSGDPIFIKGLVTDANAALGRVQIDGMSVDYTAQLSDSQFAVPQIGETIAVAGTQPSVKGVVLARATGSSAYLAQSSNRGMSVMQIGGLGTAAAHGRSGGVSVARMVGSGSVRAQITGSGAAQITGSGAAQITGSGAAASQITGSGAAQITGSGAAASQITGSGAAQITGSGAAASQITGSGAAQITGSGAAASQITGSGAASS